MQQKFTISIRVRICGDEGVWASMIGNLISIDAL